MHGVEPAWSVVSRAWRLDIEAFTLLWKQLNRIITVGTVKPEVNKKKTGEKQGPAETEEPQIHKNTRE